MNDTFNFALTITNIILFVGILAIGEQLQLINEFLRRKK